MGQETPIIERSIFYAISFTIPEDSDFVGVPTLSNSLMTKSLKTAQGYVEIPRGDLSTFKAVGEWRVPTAIPWWQLPPISWLLSTLLGVLVVSTPVSLVTVYLRDRRLKPKLSIAIPPKSATEPAIHPRNGIAFYHLHVENKGKTTAYDAELQISFKDASNKRELFSLTGKWDRGPEPLGPLTNTYLSTVWPSLIPFSEQVNIRPDIPGILLHRPKG